MHIAVIGTGYVGLVTGACFAELCRGHLVGGCQKMTFEAVGMPIYYPAWSSYVKNAQAGRLSFTTNSGA